MSKQFENFPFASQLACRRRTFDLIFDHLDSFEGGLILETGTTREENNWAGDGQSTRLWEWYIAHNPKFRGFSVDLSIDACRVALSYCKHVSIVHDDSLAFLSRMDAKGLADARLIYLDSMDWSPERHIPSSFHHLCELATIWARLPKNCLVVVDDRHNDAQGKHFLVEQFMNKLQIDPVFKGYQIGWIKP